MKRWIVSWCAAAVLATGAAGCRNEAAASAPGSAQPGPAAQGFDGTPAPGTKARCPVSGEEFVVEQDTVYSVYQGKTYGFCCAKCKPKFDADPAKYVKK